MTCQVTALEWGDFDCGFAAGRIVRRISPEHGVVVAYAKPRTLETSPATRKRLDLAYAVSRREGRACAGARLFDIFPEAMAREFNAVAKVSTLRQLRDDQGVLRQEFSRAAREDKLARELPHRVR